MLLSRTNIITQVLWYTDFVQTKNITLSLPIDLLRQAKLYAVEHDTSVNAMVRELLQESLSQTSRARAAGEWLLAVARGKPLTILDPGSIRREEIYERR